MLESRSCRAGVVRDVLLAPGWSWATTIPMADGGPGGGEDRAPGQAAQPGPWLFSLFAGVFGCALELTCGWSSSGWGRPHPTMLESTLSQDPLWACCDILPHRPARQSRGPATIARARPRTEQARGGDVPGQHRARTGRRRPAWVAP